MSTSRLISTGMLFSLLTFASCGTVNVPYVETPDHIALASAADGARLEEQITNSPITDTESGASIAANANPEIYRKKATGGTKARIALLAGGRGRNSSDWLAADNQVAGGVEFSFAPKYFPIGVEVGVIYAGTRDTTVSGSTSFDLNSTTTELYFGPRFEWSIPEGTLNFYMGLGASLIRTDADQIVSSIKQGFNDTTFGGYIHGGLELMLSDSFGVGFDLRGVYSGEATINGVKLDPSYYQGAVLFALHF